MTSNKKTFQELIGEGNIPICSVQGRPYMFTNMRIDRKTIPKGLYAYDVRDACDGECWEFQDFVLVNHWATIIGREPLATENGLFCASSSEDEETSSEGWFIDACVDSLKEYLEHYDEFLQKTCP